MFRVRIRLGFKVSQSIPGVHPPDHERSVESGDLPKQNPIYPKLDADPNIGTIRYVLIHKALMPESKVSAAGRDLVANQVRNPSYRRLSG